MRKRAIISLTVFLFALAALIGWRVTRLKEPVYQGRRESAWLRDYGLQSDTSALDEALQAMGTNAVPLLLDYLRTENSSFRLVLARFGLSFTPAELQHQWAQKGFEALAETASNAVPALIEIYTRNKSHSARQAAANALVEIGPASRPAVPVLIASATNSDPAVRAFALYTLGRLHLEPQLVVGTLTNSFRDSDREVRVQAAFGLSVFAFMGGDARSAIPTLLEALERDPYVIVRCGAAEALGHIHAQPDVVVAALARCLGGSDANVRGIAATALGEYGTNASPALILINSLLNDADSNTRKAATNALRRIVAAGEG